MLQIYQMLIPVLNLKNSHNCFNELSPKFYAGGGGQKVQNYIALIDLDRLCPIVFLK